MRRLDDAGLGEDDPLKPLTQRPQLRRRVILFSLVFGGITLWLVVQGFDPSSPTRRFLTDLSHDVQDPRWGVFYVLASFAVGTLVFAPITALFVATSLMVSPLYGLFYCLLGGWFGGSLAYAIGRLLGARTLARFRGQHLTRLMREVERRPLRSVLVARFLPIGNFTLINMALGSLRVPYRAFAGGTLLGMMPGVLGITLCKELLERVLRTPSLANAALLVAGLLFVIITLYVVARIVAERRRARTKLAQSEALPADSPQS